MNTIVKASSTIICQVFDLNSVLKLLGCFAKLYKPETIKSKLCNMYV